MSLLREIQDAAIDASVDIPVVLRKCKVLAARLGYEEFKLWIDRELNGYKSCEELPEYRILQVDSYGDFSGPFGSGLRNAPIPPSCVPEKSRDVVTTVYVMEPISYYSNLMKSTDAGSVLKSHWPAELIAHVASRIYNRMNLMTAWRLIPSSAVAALLDTVRNRILSFVLEIEAEAPDAGEAPSNVKPISEEKVSKVFHTHIMGNVGALAVGNGSVTQSAQIKVVQNDLEALKRFLASEGIATYDLDELDRAIKDDAESGVKDHIGSNVASWIGKMLAKAGTGAWKVTTTVAGNMLTKAIASYYGLG